MKKIVVVLIALISSLTTMAQTWRLDKAHSKLGFSVTHLLVSDVEGAFRSFDSKIISSKEDFSDAVFELTADINSIDTDSEQRDGHLKSPDFFDVAKYRSLSFISKSLKKTGDSKYRMTGDLTLHGVTKSVELDVIFRGTAIHPYTKETVGGFKVTGILKRSDFGIGTSTTGAVVSDEVVITANTEFTKG